MRARYLIVASDTHGDLPKLFAPATESGALKPAFSSGRIAAFVSDGCGCLSLNERGFVVGTLFHRHGSAIPIAALGGAEAGSIIESDGDRLLDRFWGGYVALVAQRDFITVLRDPSATLPCYFARGPGCCAFASDAELLLDSLELDAEIDWHEVARDLFSAGVPQPPTSLRGIHELLAGFSVRMPDGRQQRVRWSPWDHVEPQSGGIESPAERLARTVAHCVRACVSGRDRLLLSISGGLDSSIVAACLAEAGADTTCLTMFDEEDPSGDERAFARVLCEKLGLPLLERAYRLDEIDLTEVLGGNLPRSRDRTHALAYEHAHREVAGTIGTGTFVTGNGGDSVFGYSQSAAPIVDLFLSRHSWKEMASTGLDICRQTGCSLWDVAAHAIRIARRGRAYVCRPNPLFLHAEILDMLPAHPPSHPWLEAPPDTLPGTSAHIASILRVQQSLEPDRSRYHAVLNPLMSQPIVETCLGIRSWEWRKGGIDRSVARNAFAGRVPPVILKRHVKGGPSQFAARVLNQFRTEIRDRLLTGRLAHQRIVDAEALAKALKDGRTCSDEERVRILELVAAEAWLDHWTARRRASGRLPQPIISRPPPASST